VDRPPDISVVIPTLRRPRLLRRALDSVFAQSFAAFEAIVVVDGPDEATVAMLRDIADKRLRVLINPRSLTAAGARTRGVQAADGTWIAFLDDDDAWLPQKLERQMALARGRGDVLVTALSRVITPLATYVWPTEMFDGTRPLGDYLFDRRSTFAGGSFMQTSSYLLPRALYLRVPFRTNSPHDDWDFLLRLAAEPGVRVLTVPEVLADVYFEEQRASLSHADRWKASLAWVETMRPLLSRRAYAGFCLGVVAPRAAAEGAYGAALPLLLRALRHGTPRPLHLAAFVAFWLVPQGLRRRLRAAIASRRHTAAAAS
jgi:glycosyltransferase involved in cell wall biosynthesis